MVLTFLLLRYNAFVIKKLPSARRQLSVSILCESSTVVLFLLHTFCKIAVEEWNGTDTTQELLYGLVLVGRMNGIRFQTKA